MTTQHAVEKLAAAIELTTVTWRDGTTLQGEYVTIKRKEALVLLQKLRQDNKSAPALIQPAIASQDDDQSSQAVGAIATASI